MQNVILRRRLTTLMVCAGVGLLASPVAFAGAIATWTGNLQNRAEDSSGARYAFTGDVIYNDTAPHDLKAAAYGNFGSGESEVFGQALFGSLSGFATGTLIGGGYANSTLKLQDNDNLTTYALPGSGLAPGSPVDLRFTFSVNGTYSNTSTTPCPGVNCALGTATFNGVQISQNVGSINGSPESFTVHTTLGAPVLITTELAFGEGVYGGCSPCTIRLDDAANFFIDPLTPGVSYTTDSGHLYFSQIPTTPGVPEPATWALLGCGMSVIAFKRIRAAGWRIIRN